MRRTLKVISFICLGWIAISGIKLAGQLPADTSDFIEKKYSGWNGVLRGWVYSDWECSGSFISWLNSVAAEFEKAHEGVYLEFEPVTAAAMTAGDLHPPDMLIFSEGLLDMNAVPIACGGYIYVENPDVSGTVIAPEHCGPMIAMHAESTVELPESGMDLGLPAMSRMEGIEIADDAFERFHNGEARRTIVNQAQLAKLIALRNSGRGPDWRCVVQGAYSWQDQRLMLGIKAGGERAELCGEYLKLLLSEDGQRGLSRTGALPVSDTAAYDDFSAYRAMEQQKQVTTPIFPKGEHSMAELAAMVRKIASGEITAMEARDRLAQTYS